MNLSNILGGITDVARTYYNIRQMRMPQYPTMQPGRDYFAQQPIMAQPVGATAAFLPPAAGGLLGRVPGMLGGGALGFGLGELFDGGMPVPEGVCKPSDVVYQWDECSQSYVPKKKRKRRRRQLVTKGDIKGLAALKGVVGTGKIMETWIATHG